MRNLIFKTSLALTFGFICCSAPDVNGQGASALRGTVKLKDKAVAGVMVILRSEDGNQRSSLSNAIGEYEILNLQSGTYLLTVGNTPYVLKGGLGGAFMRLEIKRADAATVDLVLTEGGVLTGCVEYASKQPVIERQVIYENTSLALNGFYLMNLRNTAITNDQGCFRLYGLPGGKYRVGVGKPINDLSTDISVPFLPIYYPGVRRQAEAELIEITAGQERDLGTLVVKNQAGTSAVKGSFVDSASGNRVPNLSFQFVRYDEGRISSISTLKSDETGEFQLENQTPGQYRIQPAVRAGSNSSYTFQSISFDVSETDTSELVIQCTSFTAAIKGEVKINNNDSAGNKDCSIALKAGDGISMGDGDIYRITLNQGRFDLSGLPRGVYSLIILPLRTSLRYEYAQVGPEILRPPAGPYGIVRIDLTAGEQVVKIFLNEAASKTP
jgi:uncharacterized surface anchored protein